MQSAMLRLRDFVVDENPRVLAFFMLLADTGIRSSALCSLWHPNFDAIVEN